MFQWKLFIKGHKFDYQMIVCNSNVGDLASDLVL